MGIEILPHFSSTLFNFGAIVAIWTTILSILPLFLHFRGILGFFGAFGAVSVFDPVNLPADSCPLRPQPRIFYRHPRDTPPTQKSDKRRVAMKGGTHPPGQSCGRAGVRREVREEGADGDLCAVATAGCVPGPSARPPATHAARTAKRLRLCHQSNIVLILVRGEANVVCRCFFNLVLW